MQNIKELTLEELKKVLQEWGGQGFHAKQVFAWIYQKGIADFAAMSDLSSDLRKRLKENFYLSDLKLIQILKSKDGTKKLLLGLKDNHLIEAVIIPSEKRITGCISTQVGCRFRCSFCASGLSGFRRNLTCSEMLEEVLYLKNNALDKKLTHLVFMGTGEPLDNYNNVLNSIRIINSPATFNIGARRITISTCGIVPGIKKLSDEGLQIELSVSLHSGDDKIRSQIMPINKIYPLKELILACKEYIQRTNRQITFEYVLMKGINSSLPDAQKLSKILKDLKLCKVNLIPANPVRNTESLEDENKISNGTNPIKECSVEPPPKLEILLFRDYLLKQGISVTLRKPRGQDIAAACGQLKLRYVKK